MNDKTQLEQIGNIIWGEDYFSNSHDDEIIKQILDICQPQWNCADNPPDERCIAYTPTDDKSMQYRIIPAGLFKQVATDAIVWMPLPLKPRTPHE